jgi:hypothetical protein
VQKFRHACNDRPAPDSQPRDPPAEAPVINANAGGAVGARPAPASAEPASEWERRTKERLVRLTAQRILSHCPLPTRGRSLVVALADADGAEPLWLEAPSLTVSPVELSWMERAAPLLGETPRAVKRFANVYLLLRSIGRGRGWTPPADGQIVVLLALATGLPRLADMVLTTIELSDVRPFPLGNAIPAPTAPNDDPLRAMQLDVFQRWLAKDSEAASLDVSGLAEWVDLVRRFRFRR